MYEKEEKKLHDLKQHYDDIEIPSSIDDYIYKGIQKATTKKKHFSSMKWGSLAASLFIIVILTSIRVSPTFAGYISNIPGFEKIVDLVRYDKGLISAIENDFFQEMNVSQEHDGINVTIDGVIVDEQQMVLFYTIESERDLGHVFPEDVKLQDKNGQGLKNISTGYGGFPEVKENEVVPSTIDFYFEDSLPDSLTLSFMLSGMGSVSPTWEIPLTIDHDMYKGLKEEILINKTVSIEEQEVTFEKITILPTRVAVHLKYAEDNDKQIFAFEDLRLVDENGERWNGISNGVSGSHPSENERIIYLQSNYFKKAEELYLEFSSVRALDKDQVEVVVDTSNNEILKAPNDGLLSSVEKRGHDVAFSLNTNHPYDEHFQYSLFSHEYKDQSREVFRSNSSFSSSDGKGFQEIGIVLENLNFKNPLTFTITDYPSRITKPIRIKLK